jgi:hypothetical protein
MASTCRRAMPMRPLILLLTLLAAAVSDPQDPPRPSPRDSAAQYISEVRAGGFAGRVVVGNDLDVY